MREVDEPFQEQYFVPLRRKGTNPHPHTILYKSGSISTTAVFMVEILGLTRLMSGFFVLRSIIGILRAYGTRVPGLNRLIRPDLPISVSSKPPEVCNYVAVSCMLILVTTSMLSMCIYSACIDLSI